MKEFWFYGHGESLRSLAVLVDPVPNGGPQAGFAGTTVARQDLSLSP